MRYVMSLVAGLTVVLLASPLWAAVCVQIDDERDNLEPGERQATKTFVEDSLRRQDREIGQDNCATTYTIYSLRLGNSVTANVSGPEGSRSQKAASLDELPETYDQIISSLLSGDDRKLTSVNRQNVTKEQSAPRRQRADSLYYLRLGYGSIVGGDFNHGPAFGFGYRYELDNFGIDISGINMVVDDSDGDGVSFGLLRLGGLYFFDPISNSTPYAGAAISWGATTTSEEVNEARHTFADSGMQAEAAVGFEMLRASTIRVFVEGNAVLPFYMADAQFSDSDETRWTPVFSVSLGLAYDPNPSKIVDIR